MNDKIVGVVVRDYETNEETRLTLEESIDLLQTLLTTQPDMPKEVRAELVDALVNLQEAYAAKIGDVDVTQN